MIYISEWQQMLFLACPIMKGDFILKAKATWNNNTTLLSL
jgi:hypothetical protein